MISFSHAQGSTWNVLVPGVTGLCQGTLDGCRLAVNCNGTDKTGAVVLTATLDYHFEGSGYSGSTVLGFLPPAVPASCSVAYQVRANKL